MNCSKSLLPVLVFAAVVAGCAKHAQPATEAAQDQTPVVATNSNAGEAPGPDAQAPALPTAPSTDDQTAPTGPVNLGQLTIQLHHWIANNQRHPKNFEEFAASAKSPIPPAPEGKKFAISGNMSVILVNR